MTNLLEDAARIETWFDRRAAGAADFRPPATDAALAALADALGRPVPGDLAALLARHDGNDFLGWLPVRFEAGPDDESGGDGPEWFSLLSAAGAAEFATAHREPNAIGEFADSSPLHTDPGVREVWYDDRWVPFGGNGGGDLLVLDLAPGAGGTVGQVVAHDHESGAHRVQSASLVEFLAGTADLLESGRFRWDAREEALVPA